MAEQDWLYEETWKVCHVPPPLHTPRARRPVPQKVQASWPLRPMRPLILPICAAPMQPNGPSTLLRLPARVGLRRARTHPNAAPIRCFWSSPGTTPRRSGDG
jgi:hypothetical protein